MKVLGIGEAIIDKTYLFKQGISLQHLADAQTEKHVGGPVLTAMILLARLGIECTFIATIGRDEDALIIKQLLKHEKVTLLPKYQRRTKVNEIYVDMQTGYRQKIRGDVVHRPLHGIDKKFLQQFDAVLFDRHESTAFYEIIEKRKKSTKIIIDPSIEVSHYTRDMVRYADYPIIPIEFLTKLDTDMEKGLQKLYLVSKKPIVVTVGELGSLTYDGKMIQVVPAKNVSAIDATGAGDIYRGGFAFGILQGWDHQASATFGNLVAGLQCTKIGNAAAIPTNAEILLHACKTQTKETVNLETMDKYFHTLL